MASSQKRQQRQKRAKAGRGLVDVVKMAFVVAVVTIVAVVLIRTVFDQAPPADKFVEGVYVNGIALAGMTYEEGASLVLSQIDKRLNQDSYTLTYGDRQWVFTPSEFDAELDKDASAQLQLAWNFGHTGTSREQREQAEYAKNNPVHYDSEIIYDEVLLEDFLDKVKADVSVAPVEATVIMGVDEEITVTKSKDGLTLSVGELRQTLDQAIRAGTSGTIELQPKVQPPTHTHEELLANTQLIVDYSTSTKASSSTRTKNVKRALDAFNGIMVQPGEIGSFNEKVGVRTVENGFFKAPEYDGTEIISGIGGGTCQASSTLYGALLKANVEIVERQAHTMTVGYVKPSMDAVVSLKKNGVKDLKFMNSLDYPIYIYTQTDGELARVRIYGPPCPYEVRLDYEVVDEKVPSKGKYEKDTSGKHAYYTDEYVLKTEGKNMVKSRGFRKYFDRTTGYEVTELRQDLGLDTYYEKQPVYWIGIHERE